MSRDERVSPVQAIWDSIATDASESLLTDTQRAELDKRIAEDDANPDDVVSWEEAKLRILARLKS
ncbi:addiction module protein [Zavarzinella formosa]|uniref:addiction module protein n=1 Tax=Zavarzinella formosa TaxID=360055 RepID=UPI0003712939|nr:addiction module protein [Zavarzinella formosa]